MLLPTCIQHVWESIAQSSQILIFPIVFKGFVRVWWTKLEPTGTKNWSTMDQETDRNVDRSCDQLSTQRGPIWSPAWPPHGKLWGQKGSTNKLLNDLVALWDRNGSKAFQNAAQIPLRGPQKSIVDEVSLLFLWVVWTCNDSLVDFRLGFCCPCPYLPVWNFDLIFWWCVGVLVGWLCGWPLGWLATWLACFVAGYWAVFMMPRSRAAWEV